MGVDYLVKGKRVTAENEIGVYEVDKFVWRSTKEQTEELIKSRESAGTHKPYLYDAAQYARNASKI